MSFTIEGKITSIGEVRALENGAKVIDFRVETSEQYANLYSFDMYKAADRAEHVDNFVKYNKVGDQVSVEFNVRTNDYNGRFYTSLSPWKVEKLGQVETPTEIQQEAEDDLPF
jgi:hypothetical protein